MRPQVITTNAAGASGVIPTDYITSPFNASISTVVSGTVEYTIQHTFDRIFTATASNWYNHDISTMVSATSNQNSNYAFPIRGVRILQHAGTGDVTLMYLQGVNS